jgi:hypothetical protein
VNKFEVVKYVLDCIIRVVGKKKSDLFAITTLAEIIKQLESRYDFLKHIKVDTKVFSETWIAIQVDQKIDSVDGKILGKAIIEIINKLAKYIRSDEDYYLIREIRDELGYEYVTILQKFGVDLNFEQFEYGVFKGEREKIEISRTCNSGVLIPILMILLRLLNKPYSKDESITSLNTHIKNLEVKYVFLKYIKIGYKPMEKEFYSITISPSIDETSSSDIGDFIGKLLYEIGTSITWKGKRSFIESFKMELGADELQKIKEMDVNLDQIKVKLKRQKHKEIAQKLLETLLDLLTDRTSKDSAITNLTVTLINLQKEYEILRYITIDSSKMEEGIDIFQVTSEINNIESIKFGKAFREMIKELHDIYGDNTFVSDFKKKLGEEFLYESERVGVNLYFLELKFA